MYAWELIKMKTYCKKMKVLFTGRVKRIAVSRRLAKK
jgi:hypothetical protein